MRGLSRDPDMIRSTLTVLYSLLLTVLGLGPPFTGDEFVRLQVPGGVPEYLPGQPIGQRIWDTRC